jgi:hypothetical protein
MMLYVCKTGRESEIYCLPIISFGKEVGGVYIETSKESNESLCIHHLLTAVERCEICFTTIPLSEGHHPPRWVPNSGASPADQQVISPTPRADNIWCVRSTPAEAESLIQPTIRPTTCTATQYTTWQFLYDVSSYFLPRV